MSARIDGEDRYVADPGCKDAKVNPLQPAFLDKKVIGQPTAALKLVAQGSAALQWNGKKYAEGSGRA